MSTVRALLCAPLLLMACNGAVVESVSWGDYQPNRHDYARFRAEHPELLEPNYLPFMVHRMPAQAGEGDALVFCRWDRERLPLRVHIQAPQIPRDLQDEFDPKPPHQYVTAVRAAFETWERNLEGLVLFQYVDRRRDADVQVELVGGVGPAPESTLTVLGATPVRGACRSQGRDRDAKRLLVEFDVPAFQVYVADDKGLLNPDQVERVTLHEIGHALGMTGHSPIPGDLMYEMARDRPLGDVLSAEDVNSFLMLYRLPNGTQYRQGASFAPPPERVPDAWQGEPPLAMAPHVDARYGYELRLPQGWLRIETSHGVIAVDGVAWDYDASFQVIVRRYPTIESYFGRYRQHYVGRGEIVEQEEFELVGMRALRVVVSGRTAEITEQLVFVEIGDGRVLLVVADSPTEFFPSYREWFEASLASLEIWSRSPGAP